MNIRQAIWQDLTAQRERELDQLRRNNFELRIWGLLAKTGWPAHPSSNPPPRRSHHKTRTHRN